LGRHNKPIVKQARTTRFFLATFIGSCIDLRQTDGVTASGNKTCAEHFQNRHRLRSVSSQSFASREIMMASPRKRHWGSPFAVAFATAAALLFVNAALASQGPGGGPGAASHFTQLVMATIVYGVSALVVGAGLIGAARRR
jgi:hypothetical protein